MSIEVCQDVLGIPSTGCLGARGIYERVGKFVCATDGRAGGGGGVGGELFWCLLGGPAGDRPQPPPPPG